LRAGRENAHPPTPWASATGQRTSWWTGEQNRGISIGNQFFVFPVIFCENSLTNSVRRVGLSHVIRGFRLLLFYSGAAPQFRGKNCKIFSDGTDTTDGNMQIPESLAHGCFVMKKSRSQKSESRRDFGVGGSVSRRAARTPRRFLGGVPTPSREPARFGTINYQLITTLNQI
jgi:hypothetical protein